MRAQRASAVARLQQAPLGRRLAGPDAAPDTEEARLSFTRGFDTEGGQPGWSADSSKRNTGHANIHIAQTPVSAPNVRRTPGSGSRGAKSGLFESMSGREVRKPASLMGGRLTDSVLLRWIR